MVTSQTDEKRLASPEFVKTDLKYYGFAVIFIHRGGVNTSQRLMISSIILFFRSSSSTCGKTIFLRWSLSACISEKVLLIKIEKVLQGVAVFILTLILITKKLKILPRLTRSLNLVQSTSQ
jgi:hypothetical protein